MLIRREGFPQEEELVFCTVVKIQYHAITVLLDEYENKQGLIPISEVSAGRIRNIRDFVEEGKKIVCKVVRVDPERGHIDLSLRRVNESQRRGKTEAIKQEQKAEKIVSVLAERLKKPVEQLYREISPLILKEYPWLFVAFEDVVEKNASLEKLGLAKDVASKLEEIIHEKIKPKKVEIIIKIAIQTFEENGLELIKKAFDEAKKIAPQIQVNYLGGGTNRMLITAKDYKLAEAILKQIQGAMESVVGGKKGTITFERQGE